MDDLLDLSWQPTRPNAQSNHSTSVSSSSSSTITRNNSNTLSNLSSTSTRPNYYGVSSTIDKPPPSSTATKLTATDDAFSSLFSSSSTNKQHANLSLAERQRLATQQARKQLDEHKQRNDALWSGIESTSFGATTTSTNPTFNPALQRVASPPSSTTLANKASDPWDFDAFSSAVPAINQSSSSQPLASTKPASSRIDDPFDFDTFDQPFSSAPTLAVSNDEHQDDILGALAMPVSQASKPLDPRMARLSSSSATLSTASSRASSRVPSPASGSRPSANHSAPARASSPPPHIVGQIVEMGFSPQQAKHALARTDTGVNVQAALELLVGNGGESPQQNDNDERLARKLQADEQRHADTRFRDLDDEDAFQLERQHRRNPPQHTNSDARASRRAPVDSGASNDFASEATVDWQQQADQLYAQASEIGSSVLNKASAFWSSAKAQAQKALDERSNTPSEAGSERHRARRWGASSGTSKNKEWSGKPKWMIDAELTPAQQRRADTSSNGTASHDSQLNTSDEPAQLGSFRDSDNEDEAAVAPESVARAARGAAAAAAPAAATAVSSVASVLSVGSKAQAVEQKASQSRSSLVSRSNAASSTAVPKTGYVSPNRRATPSRSAAPSPMPPKPPVKRRAIGSDASHSICSAKRNKEEGNEHFKRGAYADAEASYTRGISALSSSSSSCESVRLVPLLSNRANVRLKNGDATGTISDCDQILAIVLSPFGGSERDADGRIGVYKPSEEAALPAELADVNLRESYAKALVRRAQALEANERWKLAKADWQVLLEYEKLEGSGIRTTASNIKFAREGLYRCGRMLGDKVVGSAVSTVGGKKVVRHAIADKASTAFVNQQHAQAAEEKARFALKDSVDAKIDAWKRGKETNLRALLSSLETVLWDDLGWKPIALHQILDHAGLKKNYTKAIATLHPDKVARNATVEHQMIAASAFHALNHAWNAQQ